MTHKKKNILQLSNSYFEKFTRKAAFSCLWMTANTYHDRSKLERFDRKGRNLEPSADHRGHSRPVDRGGLTPQKEFCHFDRLFL